MVLFYFSFSLSTALGEFKLSVKTSGSASYSVYECARLSLKGNVHFSVRVIAFMQYFDENLPFRSQPAESLTSRHRFDFNAVILDNCFILFLKNNSHFLFVFCLMTALLVAKVTVHSTQHFFYLKRMLVRGNTETV